MEAKKISGKIGIIAVFVAVLVAGIIFLAVHFTKSETSYRSIQIYELKGAATIEREKIGTITAVENLYLESGDRIFVSEGSFMRLKLDDDKYIMVEENSILSIVASGTKEESRTSIHLEQGAITNEIQNKLNKNSSYDVTTPNSVMAVRGTVFRVAITFDEKGEVFTKVSTFEGKVSTRLIFPDGTKEEKEVFVEDGKEVIIHMDDNKTEYLSEPKELDYTELPVQALEYLKEIMESGTSLEGISMEEMEALTEEKNGEDTEQAEEIEEPETEEKSQEEVEEKAEKAEEAEEEPEKGNGKETDKETETNEQPEKQSPGQKTYTVTFTYNGVIFGTQTVTEGQNATIPKLSPAESGAWDFDFSKTITGDVTIRWK